MTPDREVIHLRCGEPVLRVDVTGFGPVNLEPNTLPVGAPVYGYERWVEGWHPVNGAIGYKRRGFPIHRAHKCPLVPEKEKRNG